MRMIIVRHGESEWNRIHRYQGQLDAPLSDLGKRQADALGERLRHEQIAAIYTSSLQRAAVTAEAIARAHPDVPLHNDSALLEIHHGEWQGKYADEIAAAYGPELEEWRQFPTRSQMPGGESFSNVLKRSLDFKDRMLATHPGETVVVSTHDVVLKILVADALGMNMDRMNCIWIANASISIIDYSGVLPFLESLSETCHLGTLATTRESQKAI
jgi:probable phosphoglycerate mutase